MKVFSLLLLLTSLSHYALSVNVIDNFSDGNFSNGPSWHGDSNRFIVNSTGELQSSGLTTGGTAALSVPYTCYGSMHWQFRFRLLFNPSSTNYARIYLYANHSILQQSTESIYLKTGGESGTTDRLELWRQSGTHTTLIWSGIASRLGNSALNELQVNIQLYKNNLIQIQSKLNTESGWTTEGNTTCSFPSGNCWFGYWYTCTATRASQFFFDDISINTGTPAASRAILNDQQQLLLSFTQPMDTSCITTLQHYQLLPSGTFLTATTVNHADTCVQLSLSLPQAGPYKIICTSLIDQEGQTSVQPDTLPFRWKPPIHRGELLITEIMFDPDPSAGLPLSEYIELYNNSSQTISTEGITISDGTTIANFPTVNIHSGEHLLVIPSTASSLFSNLTNTVTLSAWPSLNNDADDLILYDEKRNILHRVSYSTVNLPDDNRNGGGYSIEAGNTTAWCKGEEIWNWTDSPNGGTPSSANSFYLTITDGQGPVILNAIQESSNKIILYLNEKADTTQLALSNFRLEPSTIMADLYSTDDGATWTILFNGDTNTSYTLYINQISDCMGNANLNLSVSVVSPRPPSSALLEPSEILFNPLPYGADFIEVYNNSIFYIDLKNCKLGSDAAGRRTVITLPDEHLILGPEKFLALTINEKNIRDHYTTADAVHEISSLPPYPDDEACVWMEDSNGITLFNFCYSSTQHQQLLKDEEGVSLERISFHVNEDVTGNWTSSASTNHYATPGYRNSATINENTTEEINISPRTLEPGNSDLQKALINIEFHPIQSGVFARCRIYDEAGNITRELMSNNSIGEGSIITWEGVNEKGAAVHPGLYLVYIECWNASGYYAAYKQWVGVH